jgi:hypothetical protein
MMTLIKLSRTCRAVAYPGIFQKGGWGVPPLRLVFKRGFQNTIFVFLKRGSTLQISYFYPILTKFSDERGVPAPGAPPLTPLDTPMEIHNPSGHVDAKSHEKETIRFVEPISNGDREKILKSRFTTKTELKSKLEPNLFHSWLRKYGHRSDIRVIKDDLLSIWMQKHSTNL